MPLIEVTALSRNYQMGDTIVKALQNVTVSIEPGEFVAVMGPSGSGKSTFMNLLGCLDQPTTGKYLLEEQDVGLLTSDELAAIRNLKVGFVFQTFSLLARTSAIENVELPLIYNGVTTKERRRRAIEQLSALGLSDRLHHKPNELSGGQQQRVAIARALVNRPVVVLADEPTGALDTRTGVEIMAIFQNLNIQGITIVVVTHEIDVAMYAKRIITFRDGKITSDEQHQTQKNAASVIQGTQ